MNNTEKVGGAIRDIKVYSESELKLEINNFGMFTLGALNCIACYKSFYKVKERPMPEKEIEESNIDEVIMEMLTELIQLIMQDQITLFYIWPVPE